MRAAGRGRRGRAVRATLAREPAAARRRGGHLARVDLVGGRAGPDFPSRSRSAPSPSRRWPRSGPRRRRSSTPRCGRAARRARRALRFVGLNLLAGVAWPVWSWRSRACWRSPSTRRRWTCGISRSIPGTAPGSCGWRASWRCTSRRSGRRPSSSSRRAASGACRRPRSAPRLTLLTLWVAPTLVAGAISSLAGWPLPIVGLLLSSIACAVAALLARRVVVWYRHATIAARIFAPVRHVSRAGGAALSVAQLLRRARHRAPDHDLRRRGAEPLGDAARPAEGSAGRDRPARDAARPREGAPATPCGAAGSEERVLRLEPDGARAGAPDLGGRVVQRQRHAGQPLRVEPARVHRERAASRRRRRRVSGTCSASRCRSGRRSALVLHAERALCLGGGDDPRRSGGTIVLHLAVDDYRTLPFITSQSPYFELFRPSPNSAGARVAPGNDVQVAIYGWGLEPVYTSGLVGLADHGRALSAHLPSRPPAVLGNASRSTRTPTRSTSPTTAPASTPSATRGSRSSITWCIWPR